MTMIAKYQTQAELEAEELLLAVHNLNLKDEPTWKDIKTELKDLDAEALTILKGNLSGISRRITSETNRRKKLASTLVAIKQKLKQTS